MYLSANATSAVHKRICNAWLHVTRNLQTEENTQFVTNEMTSANVLLENTEAKWPYIF